MAPPELAHDVFRLFLLAEDVTAGGERLGGVESERAAVTDGVPGDEKGERTVWPVELERLGVGGLPRAVERDEHVRLVGGRERPLGVRVAVADVDGHETAYVLVDGNNMEPGLRGELIDALVAQGPVDAAEILTTDTHVVNTVEADNQVGTAVPWDRLEALVCDLTDAARADREPVEAGAATERATVTVFGNDRTEALASHANAVVAMGGAFAVSVVLAAVAVSILIFLFA